MCSRSLLELPCDVLQHITEILVEYHPRASINMRSVNREFNYHHTNACKSYETELCLMMSACRISVLSPKARLKYTLQYIRSIGKDEGVVENEETINLNEETIKQPTNRLYKRDIVFFVLLFFILLTPYGP